MSKQASPSPEQLSPQVAYLALKDGTPVHDRDGGRIGVVEHVMAAGGIFEGIIVHTHPLPGRHLYADADQVAEIHQRGVLPVGGIAKSSTTRAPSMRGDEARDKRTRSRRDCEGVGRDRRALLRRARVSATPGCQLQEALHRAEGAARVQEPSPAGASS